MTKTKRAKSARNGRSRVRERLVKAQLDGALVRIKRWIEDGDQVEGFVLSISKDWVLLAKLDYRIDLDGWAALRIDDIQAVTRYPVEDCFEIKALKARAQWPPVSPAEGKTESLTDLLDTGQQGGRLITLYREHERPQVYWIGSTGRVQKDVVSLLEVSVAGGWARKPRRFDVEDITRVEFGGRYEDALLTVAGAAPAASRS